MMLSFGQCHPPQTGMRIALKIWTVIQGRRMDYSDLGTTAKNARLSMCEGRRRRAHRRCMRWQLWSYDFQTLLICTRMLSLNELHYDFAQVSSHDMTCSSRPDFLPVQYINAHQNTYNIYPRNRAQSRHPILKMIVLKRIAFLRPLLLHAATLMRFSEEAKREQLSVSAQKAVWATSIIQTISKASLPKTIRDPTLRDVILNLPDPSAQFHFEKSEREKVMDLFKEGIYLAPAFLAQPRVIQAQQIGKENQEQKKFIFFPNQSVTTPMFQQLLRYSEQVPYSLLLTGGFGTSKTVSMILYVQLSNYQTLYVYQALKGGEKEKEYNKLIQMNLIPKTVPKYWYWSAHYGQDKPIIKLLVDQAIEIEQNIKDQLQKETSLSQFITKLRRLYPKPIISRPIVDQINFIASALRQQNQHHQTHNPHSIISEDSNAAKYLSLLKKLLLLGSNFTLNSSMTIEIDLLQQDSNSKLAFDFYGAHNNFQITHIPYEKSIATKEGQIDFWQTFWFEMERRMKLYSKTQAEIAAAKQTFYKSASSVKVSNLSSFHKFVYARTFLNESYSSLLKALGQQSDELIQEQLQDFTFHCIKDSEKNLRSYYQKGNTQKRKSILESIFLEVHLLQDIEILWTSQFKLTKRQMENIIFGLYKQDHKFTSQNKNRNRNFSEQQVFIDLKPFLKSWQDDIQFIYTASQLNTLLYHLLLQENTHSELLYWAMITSTWALGVRIQNFLQDCLQSKGQMDLKATSKSTKEEVSLSFKIFKTVSFKPINDLAQEQSSSEQKSQQTPQEQPSIIQNFALALEQALQNPYKDILALPYPIKNGKIMRQPEYSAPIDFFIIHYKRSAQKIYIWTFDTTVTEDLTDKIQEAQTLLQKLISKQSSFVGYEIEISHTILIIDQANNSEEQTSISEKQSPNGVDSESDEGKDKPKVNFYFAQLENITLRTKDYFALKSVTRILSLNKKIQEKQKLCKQIEEDEQELDIQLKYMRRMIQHCDSKVKQYKMELKKLEENKIKTSEQK